MTETGRVNRNHQADPITDSGPGAPRTISNYDVCLTARAHLVARANAALTCAAILACIVTLPILLESVVANSRSVWPGFLLRAVVWAPTVAMAAWIAFDLIREFPLIPGMVVLALAEPRLRTTRTGASDSDRRSGFLFDRLERWAERRVQPTIDRMVGYQPRDAACSEPAGRQ